MNPVSLRAIGVGKELAARGLDTEIAQDISYNGWLEQCAASISMVVDLSATLAAIFDCKLRSDLKVSFGIKEDDMARKRYIAAKLRQVVTYADGILVSGALRYVTIVTACTGPGPFKLPGLPLGGFADFSYVRHLFYDCVIYRNRW
jgi:hypothetical protein